MIYVMIHLNHKEVVRIILENATTALGKQRRVLHRAFYIIVPMVQLHVRERNLMNI